MVGWRKCSSFSHIHMAALTLLLKGGAGKWGQGERERWGALFCCMEIRCLWPGSSRHLPRPGALLHHNKEHDGDVPCSQSLCEMQSYSCFKLFFKLRDN